MSPRWGLANAMALLGADALFWRPRDLSLQTRVDGRQVFGTAAKTSMFVISSLPLGTVLIGGEILFLLGCRARSSVNINRGIRLQLWTPPRS
jgi:hypothetical protein